MPEPYPCDKTNVRTKHYEFNKRLFAISLSAIS
jgi:hypothetical protein